ncbi:calcineurin-like phosphoesterase C-terminal domain-containing protein [Xanthomonas bonasiae]|uniref:calcineurin-like phosphoesterase C-terminal domain-containing protein n=1 Tax=Xanthomonas bonasiae TaxID=2810351 RepID=UPI00178559A5|nr:calcineurin-like phosphoesterase family protein [Xanthomonas surreyensis]MBD7924653.1 calcineurin-like phosphoesterase C-terminal domain-containing protein [Xanthomonas surreyensis]
MSLRVVMLTCLLTAALPALAQPATISGSVYQERDGHAGRGNGERGIAGVQVSDGVHIVHTDAQGRYSLAVEPGRTVFVIKPDGYAFESAGNGLPDYWRHYAPAGSPKLKYPGIAPTSGATSGWDFALRAQAPAASTEVLVFTDTQAASATDVGYYARDIVAPLVGKAHARLGTTLGDVVSDNLALYPALNAETAKLGVPWFHVPGNHDLNFDAADDAGSLSSWRAIYGPDTYAVEEGGASFVFLDDVVYRPKQQPDYIGGLREDQFAFLQAYLATLPKDRLLVLGMHIPLFDAAPGRETFRHADRARLFGLLQAFPHVLVLSGHTHTQRHYYHGADDGWHGAQPLHEYNVGAACGAYWSGVKDADGIPATTMADGTPNGYAVLDVKRGGDYALAYHAARAAGDPQLQLHAPRLLRRKAYPDFGVYANVFMGEDDSRVEYRIDEGAWKPMVRVQRPDPDLLAENARDDAAEALRGYDRSPEAVPSQHLWRGTLPTDLAAGAHRIEVRAFDRWRGEQRASTDYRLQDATP